MPSSTTLLPGTVLGQPDEWRDPRRPHVGWQLVALALDAEKVSMRSERVTGR
ncbi:hypothetical protein LP416_27755 [Polaromonas sp. P2-4]|nr:hypothetical protein LP416_27755 [Polaromonas sp. P2-4]